MVIYGGTDYNVDNTTTYPVSNICISREKSPYGFPIDPTKWRVRTTDSTNRSQSTTTRYDWYNIGTTNSQLVVPIGAWRLRYKVILWGSGQDGQVTLSTTNNTESDSAFTSYVFSGMMAVGSTENLVNLSSETTYYLNAARNGATLSDFFYYNSKAALVIEAVSAYL